MHNKRLVNTICFVLGGIPLLIYPFVVIANIMQMAGESSDDRVYLSVIVYLFLFLSTTYLLTYLACLILFFIIKRKRKLLPIIPLVHLVLTVIIGILWAAAE
uniref:Uncharacterized protein n=1 Tax=Cohnella candidum TaxID=2674991 RepID=A0A3G3JX90_9BACL|nr:hypothetical protein EAV92_07765 [Cohnella candidum]